MLPILHIFDYPRTFLYVAPGDRHRQYTEITKPVAPAPMPGLESTLPVIQPQIKWARYLPLLTIKHTCSMRILPLYTNILVGRYVYRYVGYVGCRVLYTLHRTGRETLNAYLVLCVYIPMVHNHTVAVTLFSILSRSGWVGMGSGYQTLVPKQRK